MSAIRYQLRPYQEAIRLQIHEAFKEHSSTLAVLATGSGKSFLASQIISDFYPRKTLWIVHTRELVFQAAREIRKFTGLEVDIEMAGMRADQNLLNASPVVVASRDTLISGTDGKRFKKFDPGKFSLIVVDECHRATAGSYDSILTHFRKNPESKLLGLTATPNRHDEAALGKVFASVAGVYDIEDAIRDGYLVHVRAQSVEAGCLDYSHISTTAGDLNGAELAALMEAEEPMQKVAQATYEAMYGLSVGSLAEFPPAEWKSKIEGRTHLKTLVFCVRVQHAEMLAAILNRIESGCAQSVDGKTDHKVRKDCFRDYHSGKIKVLTNVGVMTEGYDEPGVQNIIMARPTKSRPLFLQMLGRSTRVLPGVLDGLETTEARLAAIAASPKPFATVYDFTGNSGQHKIVRTIDALGGNFEENEIEAARKEAEKLGQEGKSVEVLELLRQKREEIRLAREERLRREETMRTRVVAKSQYSVRSVNLFDTLDLVPQRSHGWDAGKRLSAKQVQLLAKQGINGNELPYAHGQQLINEMFRRWNGKLATFKQCKLLKKYGYATKDMTFKEASAVIDALAKNGWRRPDAIQTQTPEPVHAGYDEEPLSS